MRSFYQWKKELLDIKIKAETENKTILVSNEKRGRKTAPKNKLKKSEEKEIREKLLKLEWIDLSPREIYYKILDEEGRIIASPSTFYRLARREGLLLKRVKQSSKRPLNREMPCILTLAPNECWSWDVSQIQSTNRNERFYLYVILDIWSRLVVGWTLEKCEKTEHAIEMWQKTLMKHNLTGDGLINHKDNGSIMTSGEMLKFVRDAQMVDSYSRAGVSDDNPFSESLFGTIKTFRTFPGHFNSLDDANVYFQEYFDEYNYTYKHSRIQFLTPAERHYGEEGKILALRNKVIQDFCKKNPHRYSSAAKMFKPILEVKIN